MTIATIMSKTIITATADSSILEVARLMYSKHVGQIIIIADATPIGIVTDRDLVLNFAKSGVLDPASKVVSIMSHNVITVRAHDDIYETLQKMKDNGVRNLPVVSNEGHLIGMATLDDCLKILGDEINFLGGICDSEVEKEKMIEAKYLHHSHEGFKYLS